MRMKRRGTLVLLILPLLLGFACDPMAPGATGQIRVSPDAKLEAGRTLELRMRPDDGQPFDPASMDLSGPEWQWGESMDLAGGEFPSFYGVGGGVGHSEFQHWRLVAWIAESEAVDSPKEGEWFGTRLFEAAECGFPFDGYCGITYGVDLEIDERF